MYGCASPNTSPTNASAVSGNISEDFVSTKGMPKWMQDAFARESNTPFKPTPYSIDELGINLTLPGKPVGGLQDTESSKFLRIDIGAGKAMGCEIYSEEFDPALSIAQLADHNFKTTSEQIGKVSNKALFFTDSGAYENRPYHALEWIANLGKGNKKTIALFKYRLAMIGDYGLACQHPEVGYRNTFENAFKYLADNFNYNKSDTELYLVEIASMSINDKAIGFIIEKYSEDADGDTVVSHVTSMLIPSTNQSITPIDNHALTYSTPQGAIINSYKSSVENGDIGYDLALDYDSNKEAWVVSGEFRGKSFGQTLQHDSYIDSSLGQRTVVKDLTESDEANSGQIYIWDPDINPAAVSSITINLDEKSGEDRQVSYNIGPIRLNGTVDSNGSLKEATVDAGSQRIVVERQWLGRE